MTFATSKSPPNPNTQDSADRIHIISYNCLGLKYISHHRAARLSRIGHAIAHASPIPDIVGLQECWTQEDYRSIRTQTSHILPYGKFYYNGALGAGLAILSRWPITESSMHGYPLNGRPTAFFRGDWYVGKGVAHARIRISKHQYTSRPPSGASSASNETTTLPSLRDSGDDTSADTLEFFTTHLHAPYEREPNDSYICHRTAQAHHIARLIRDARQRGHLTIACGDFNMLPDSLAHDLVVAHGGVVDAWHAAGRDEDYISASRANHEDRRRGEGKGGASVRWKVEEEGATCDSMGNTWRWPPKRRKALERCVKRGRAVAVEDAEVGWEEEDWPGAKRLDYVFLGNAEVGRGGKGGGEERIWEVESARVGMTERHPELRCSLSDHFSVECTLVRFHRPPPGADSQPTHLRKRNDLTPPLPSSHYSAIIAMTAKYMAREQRQRKARIAHYFTAVTVTIGCWVAVWWSPHNGVAFALMVVASLWLMGGTVDGLIGFLFMGSEIASLREFEWEMRELERRAERGEGAGG